MPDASETARTKALTERTLLRFIAVELFKRAHPEDREALLAQLRNFATEQFAATLGSEVAHATEAASRDIEALLVSAAHNAE